MIKLKRPIGLRPLLMVLATLAILTIMLGAMIAKRVSVLENGTEVVLKTAPIDPRDLLRGYFVRLRYDISAISPSELKDPKSYYKNWRGYKRNAQVFVKLQADSDGFWSPISLHLTKPKGAAPDQSVYIRGRVIYGTCGAKPRKKRKCNITIRYGIEKFFADKQRAKKLEDFARQSAPEVTKLRDQINKLQKTYRRRTSDMSKTEKNANRAISVRLATKRVKLAKLVEQNRQAMATRFAVIARLDKQSGEAAISGLQLDGKRIYEERLF